MLQQGSKPVINQRHLLMGDQSVCLLEKQISSPPTKRRIMLFYIHIYIYFNYIKINVFLDSTKFSPGLHRQAVALTRSLPTYHVNKQTNKSTASGEKVLFLQSSGFWSSTGMETPSLWRIVQRSVAIFYSVLQSGPGQVINKRVKLWSIKSYFKIQSRPGFTLA